MYSVGSIQVLIHVVKQLGAGINSCLYELSSERKRVMAGVIGGRKGLTIVSLAAKRRWKQVRLLQVQLLMAAAEASGQEGLRPTVNRNLHG